MRNNIANGINYNYFRNYFESGCFCLIMNKIEKYDGECDKTAVEYYEDKCTCSRLPSSMIKKCWDRE